MDWSDLPPLSTLRAFEAAARNRGYSAAGREMNVTHAAVGQQVRRLEAHLNTALVLRQGRGIALTPEGAALARALSESFALMRRALEAFAEADARRPLRVSMTPSFAVSWLMPRIGAFRAEHPEIELMLNPSIELVDLPGGDFDLAIRFGRGDWPGLEVEPLVPSNFVVVAAEALARRARVETPDDLLRLPWLQELGTDELGRWLTTRGIPVSEKHDVTHLPGHMMLSALRDGQGVGCTARVFVEEDVKAGRLRILFEDSGDGATGYHLVRRPGPMRAPLELFVAWLRLAAREDRAEARP